MNIGRRIQEIREDLGMPATVLARRAGVAPNTIYRIETGERTPSVALLERIARELRTEPWELLREPAVTGKDEAADTRQRSSRSSHEPPEDEARGPERASSSAPVGTLEWAVAAPEDEYARWIERASSMELHAIFAKLRADTDDPRRPLILDRVQAAIDEFFRRNPIEKIIDRREAGSADEAGAEREVG
jgi:transcriptional regulator with XRE-family HTH domain